MVGGKLFNVRPLYLFVYMSAIAGQTAGPNELTFFEGALKYPRGKSHFFYLMRNAGHFSQYVIVIRI